MLTGSMVYGRVSLGESMRWKMEDWTDEMGCGRILDLCFGMWP
jgi:hypothetical protein